MIIKITDNSSLAKQELQIAAVRALEKCGLVAEGYAKKLCAVDTGNLRNSIAHVVDEGGDVAYIGSASEYAPYVIRKRNLGQESIILVAALLHGCIRTLKVNTISRMGNALNHT